MRRGECNEVRQTIWEERVLHKRMRFGLSLALALVAATALHAAGEVSDANFKLTFDKPATKWTEALPLGNGRIGAMVFGGTEDERLQINESTLWGGGPHDYTNPEAYPTSTKFDS